MSDFSQEGLSIRESPDPRVLKLVRMWNKRMLRSASAHYMAAERCEHRETILSIVNIVSAIFVLFLTAATKLVETLDDRIEGMDLSILVPLASAIVVCSSAVQYIRQYSARASVHKQVGNEYSNLRRKLERYWTKSEIHPEALHAFNRAYNQISKSAPLVPKKIWIESGVIKESEAEDINGYYFSYVNIDEDLDTDTSCPPRPAGVVD